MQWRPTSNGGLVLDMDGALLAQVARTPKRRKRRLPKNLSREEVAALMQAPNLRSSTGVRDRVMLELMHAAERFADYMLDVRDRREYEHGEEYEAWPRWDA